MLQEKMKSGTINFKDKRGLHLNRPHRVPQVVKDKVRQHISSFPKQDSHYSRGKTSQMYLNADLSVQRMYNLFKEMSPEVRVSKHFYEDTFRSDFNLQFGTPRSDSCATCDKYYNDLVSAETEEARDSILKESEFHHRRAEKAYSSLNGDIMIAKENVSVVVLCVDLQQVLFCPTLTHSNVFYQRQLATYNFAVSNMLNNETVMHVWNETTAKRGSAEIASCILKYITSIFNVLENGQQRKLILWSDRCVGQNNNWRMITLVQHLILSKYFSQVNQKFLCSGHSFLPCDRSFAQVEKRKKVSKVYVPHQWVDVIKSAQPSKPFTVYEMNRVDFLNFNMLDATLRKDPKLKITDAMWLQIDQDDPSTLRMRHHHNNFESWSMYSVTKRRGNVAAKLKPVDLNTLPALYDGKLSIKKEKKADLMDMCKYLPIEYQAFYADIAGE